MTQDIAFIVYGPLRSGTTLLRLMIHHHPDLANAGEFDYLFDYARHTPEGISIDRERLRHWFAFQNFGFVIREELNDDQLLEDFLKQVVARKPGMQSINIHRDLDHVLSFLPAAKVVKLHRDPRDVAASSVQMGWAGNAYHGVDHWISTERAWDRASAMLPPERKLELRFEDLLAQPEAELGRICDFIGVSYHPAMLSYSEHSTYEPVSASATFRWKQKMSPAQAALVTSRAPELVAARGYEVPQGVRAPGPVRRAQLAVANKLGMWRHSIRIHGFSTVVMEKITRRLGLARWHGRIVDERINRTLTARLK